MVRKDVACTWSVSGRGGERDQGLRAELELDLWHGGSCPPNTGPTAA